MLRPPEIRLPPRPRWPRIAIAASVAVHSLLVFGWVEGRLPQLPRRPRDLIVLALPAEGPAAVPMPFRFPRTAGGTGGGVMGDRPSRPALPLRPRAATVVPEPETPADTASETARRRAAAGRIGAGLAEGRLWVRPLPLPPRDLARRLTKGQVELVDSAVTAIVQAYLDSIATDPALRAQRLPSWTKDIAGRKFGIDSKNIYIAGLKIPAAVLALLPIPAGNMDQNRAYNHLMELREDLQTAGRRADNLEQFKEMIREMRLRKEREREFERNQRTEPAAAPAPTDSAVP